MLTALLVAASIATVVVFGIRLGIEFTGGTYAKVSFEGSRPSVEQMTEKLRAEGMSDFSVRQSGEQSYDVRVSGQGEEQQTRIARAVSTWNAFHGTVVEATHVGPTIGVELRNKAWIALALVLTCILLFIAFAFRKVSEPVSSWIYGFIALITLLHDVIVPTGFFALLGHFTGAQMDTLFVTAILTVLGFSVHDTIVVFDRVRENLRTNQEKGRKEDFAETAGRSLQQTFVRSINTSLTVVLTLVALYVFGPASTEVFALTLLVGIVAGTYSSVFLATPLLVSWERKLTKRR